MTGRAGLQAGLCLALVFVLGLAPISSAQTGHAVIVSGATGGGKYAQAYDQVRATLVETLRTRWGLDGDRVRVLAERAAPGVEQATRENVRRVLGDLRTRATRDDLVLIVLLGHGTYDGAHAKFNLVGPDLTADEWAELLRPIQARLTLVDTTASSFPFLARLSGRNRIVLTATDSPAQRYRTVFPEFFVQGLADGAADLDKDGRVSVWEAFTYASTRVKQHYEQRGQLSTERALLDDNGDGVGKEAGAPGPDGVVARRTFLDPDAPLPTEDAAVSDLLRRRAQLEARLEDLKARKSTLAPDVYARELEAVLVDLARVGRLLRSKS